MTGASGRETKGGGGSRGEREGDKGEGVSGPARPSDAAKERSRELDARRQQLRRCMDASATLIMQQEADALGVTLSDSVVGAFRDCAVAYAEQLASDLRMFARHAKRNRVTTEDVLLAARRNEAVVGRLREMAAGMEPDSKGAKKRKAPGPPPS